MMTTMAGEVRTTPSPLPTFAPTVRPAALATPTPTSPAGTPTLATPAADPRAWTQVTGGGGAPAPGAGAPRGVEPQTILDPNAGTGLGVLGAVGIAADIAGIFDPTPISDGVSAALSLGQGDFKGAALSAASMVPFLGDAVAKPAKLIGRVVENFPHLAKFATRADDLFDTLKKVGTSPEKLDGALRTLNNMHGAAEVAYKNEKYLAKANKLNLPTDGPIPFVPPKNWDVTNPTRGKNHGFIDAYGNEWTKGPSRTPGEPFEWDVQLRGQSGLTHMTRDGSHLNVSMTGRVTHK